MNGEIEDPDCGNNLFKLPSVLPADEEFLEMLAEGRDFRLERIVSAGQATAPGEWFDQEWDEWVALLQGRAILRYEDGRSVEMESGDWLLIPARLRHRVEKTSDQPPCIWLAIHFRSTSRL